MPVSSIASCCELCSSRHLLSFHHLIPRSCHHNKWFRKRFTLDEMRERGVILCRKCHAFIHRSFTEKQLGRELNTLAALRQNATLQHYVQWARKQN